MIKQLIAELRQTTLAQFIRVLSGAAIALTSFWMFAGPFVRPFVSTAMAQIMTEQGVSPKDFKNALEDLEQVHTKIDDLLKSSEKSERETQSLLNNQELLKSQNIETAKMVDKLLNLQLKQSGMASP